MPCASSALYQYTGVVHAMADSSAALTQTGTSTSASVTCANERWVIVSRMLCVIKITKSVCLTISCRGYGVVFVA